MATAVLTNVPATISTAESITGWTGDTFALEPDIKKQGSNSVACALTPNAGNNQEIYYTGFTAADLSSVHLRMWFQISFIADLATTDAIQVFISDGTNTAYWTVYDNGPAEYGGGWVNVVVDTSSTPTSGTKPTGNSTRVGMNFSVQTKPRNVPANAWFDAWYYGDGYTITGGTSGDEIDWSHVAVLDNTAAYGVVESIDEVYFMSGDVTVGSGATTTYFSSGQKIQFKDLPVLSTLYSVTFEGSACNVDIAGGSYGAAGTQDYVFDASDTNLNSFDLTGVQFNKASSILFSAGSTITNTVFDNCGQVVPSTSTFSGNVFSNYVGTDGAMLFPSTSANLSNLNFINCDNGVEYETGSDTTTPTFTNFTFDDVSGNFDVNNTSTTDPVTITISGGGNANSYNTANGEVVFSNPKQFKFTLSPSITSYEWRIYSVTAVGSLDGATELDGEETATADNQTYNYTYSADQAIAVQIISQPDEDYEEKVQYFTLVSTNQDVTINLEPDNNN